MLAARADQENAVHARQTAAAAKPLNQGVQGFTAKTPGHRAPKTPFKVALNDENKVEGFGKGGLGTNGKRQGGKQQGGKAEKNLFQTPAPRDRPALGFKTTNAKAIAFQTPAPKTLGPSPEKTQRRTVGRSRIQIHKEVQIVEPEIDWGNEEIQYIPPQPVPLLDAPSDDEWDKADFSILKSGNVEGGRWSDFYARRKVKDDAEEARWRKEEQEEMKRTEEEFYRRAMQDLRDPDSDEELPPMKLVTSKQQSRPLSTITSRSAASALSRPAKAVGAPSYAAPTAATKAKAPFEAATGHSKNGGSSLSNNNARAASYSTLGYAKGRAVSHTIKKQPVNGVFKDEAQHARPKRSNPLKELEDIIRAREFEDTGINADDLDDFSSGGVALPDGDDEDDVVFQMKIPDA